MRRIVREIAGELVGMFVADGRLALAILAVIAAAWALVRWSGLDPRIGGAVLLAGSLGALLGGIRRAARKSP
ncbi:MAG TPA: hypothetical protein VFX06_10490 [Stellaceae bacterium]|jgi:hypothetical protein|nr:hypothetical protein [Stellaceae bacterium]